MSLQWSRFFSKRKILWTRGARYLVVVPSMEPLFFKAENGQPGDSQVSDIPPSMEPLFFKAENSSVLAKRSPSPYLQWSRFFSKRKIQKGLLAAAGSTFAFNGAAFFQSGKCPIPGSVRPRKMGLQWSRFFSKRKIPRQPAFD